MEIPSTIASLILLGLLTYTAVRMVLAIGHNFRWGLMFRRRFAERIRSLRLSKMLAHLGVNQAEYLHSRPVSDIEMHMRRCNACDNKGECDDKLEGEAPTDNYDFCPNEPSLRESIPARDLNEYAKTAGSTAR